MTVDLLLGAAKLFARCYLEAVPDETSMKTELQALADATTSDTFDALHRLRLLAEKIEQSSWAAGAMPGDARSTVAMFAHSAWHYTFMTYFHLERKARQTRQG